MNGIFIYMEFLYMEYVYKYIYGIYIKIYKGMPTGNFTKREKMQMQTFPGHN